MASLPDRPDPGKAEGLKSVDARVPDSLFSKVEPLLDLGRRELPFVESLRIPCKEFEYQATNTSRREPELSEQDLESVFKRWVNEYHGVVLKVARAYTLSREDCEDLAQEILLQVWCSLPRFQGRACGSTWFYRVALNTALGWHRKEHRRHARQHPVFQVEDLPSSGLDSVQQVVQRESVERLYAAIRQLPKTDAALVLLYLDDLSYREIAEVLGISETNVGARLNRAKKALGELLNGDYDEH